MTTTVCEGVLEERRINFATLFNSQTPEPMGGTTPSIWFGRYNSPDSTKLSYQISDMVGLVMT